VDPCYIERGRLQEGIFNLKMEKRFLKYIEIYTKKIQIVNERTTNHCYILGLKKIDIYPVVASVWPL
jgi:hypothetical protein